MDIASSSPARLARRLRTPLVILGAIGVLMLVGAWGGSINTSPQFYAGLAALSGLFIVFGFALWWLYASPLPGAHAQPAAQTAPSVRTVEIRQMLVLLCIICGLLATIGALWDQAWHQVFGGFGDDFLWPPHFALYGSMGMMALFAAGGMLLIARGKGGLRERFRAEPALGLLGLTCAYVVASVPSDEVWHRIYGLDLTAWSLPHVLLGFTIHLVFLSATALQLSILPKETWQGLRGLRWQHLAALLTLMWAVTTFTQLNTADWEGVSRIGAVLNEYDPAFWSRPEWLYPVVLATLSVYYGNTILHATRRAGSATLVALGALAVRATAIAIVSQPVPEIALSLTPHLALVAPMAALDLWYYVNRQHADETRTQATGHIIAGTACLAAGLPIIAATMAYPRINGATILGAISFGMLMALVAGWVGVVVGRWLGSVGERPEDETPVRGWIAWASAAAFVIAVVGIALYMRFAPLPTPLGS